MMIVSVALVHSVETADFYQNLKVNDFLKQDVVHKWGEFSLTEFSSNARFQNSFVQTKMIYSVTGDIKGLTIL